MPTVLLTGGAGYIGSHTCVEADRGRLERRRRRQPLQQLGGRVDRIEKITGTRPAFIEADVRDRARSTGSSPSTRSTRSSTSRA